MSTGKGVKLDDGKPRMDLVLGEFRNALWEIGRVGTYGAKKYTDNGWQEVDNAEERYLSAMIRHYIKYKSGMYDDEETKLPHLAHMAWNALAVLELATRQTNFLPFKVSGGTYDLDRTNITEYDPLSETKMKDKWGH